jgi:hypothetical protein
MSDRPQDDARIRALLAELGSGPAGDSMPPEVAARLDDALARLVAERDAVAEPDAGAERDAVAEPAARPGGDGAQEHGSVVPLRRRWASRLTVAAAAVVVVGVGGVTAASVGLLGGDSPTGANSSADRTVTQGQDGAGGRAESGSGSGTAADPSAPLDHAAKGGAVLSASTFAADVAALLRDRTEQAQPPETSRSLRSSGCPGPRITDGAVPSRVTYDGRPAVLVVHPLRDGRRLVEAWTCTGDHTLDTTTLGE